MRRLLPVLASVAALLSSTAGCSGCEEKKEPETLAEVPQPRMDLSADGGKLLETEKSTIATPLRPGVAVKRK